MVRLMLYVCVVWNVDQQQEVVFGECKCTRLHRAIIIDDRIHNDLHIMSLTHKHIRPDSNRRQSQSDCGSTLRARKEISAATNKPPEQ